MTDEELANLLVEIERDTMMGETWGYAEKCLDWLQEEAEEGTIL